MGSLRWLGPWHRLRQRPLQLVVDLGRVGVGLLLCQGVHGLHHGEAGIEKLGEAAELDALPGRIDALEAERAATYVRMADQEVVRDPSAMLAANARLREIERELEDATARWEALETIAGGS